MSATEYQHGYQYKVAKTMGLYINDKARHKHEASVLFNNSSYAYVLKD